MDQKIVIVSLRNKKSLCFGWPNQGRFKSFFNNSENNDAIALKISDNY